MRFDSIIGADDIGNRQYNQAFHVQGFSRGETGMASSADRSPQHHTQNMKKRFQETITHLRQDITKVDRPQLKAILGTSAEVLTGLTKALDDYDRPSEAAWRKQ